jgi:hypothetical protein
MINLDLSKVLRPSAFTPLVAFMPGLFLEICIALGNPEKVAEISSHAQLDKTMAVVVALILAFVIGNAFCLWVYLIQRSLTSVHQVASWCWTKLMNSILFTHHPIQSRFSKLKIQVSQKAFFHRAFQKANARRDFRGVVRAWERVTKTLLQHYGIPTDEFSDFEWENRGAWVSAFGLWEPEDFRGNLLVVGAHATGWSGLAAMHYAPKLHTGYFLAFCWFSIVYGLLHDWSVAQRLATPRITWQIGLRRTMEVLKRTVKDQPKESEPEKPVAE